MSANPILLRDPEPGPAPSVKKGRDLYVRFFQNQLIYVAECLDPPAFRAWVRLTAHYVRLNGDVVNDDVLLARLAGLKPTAWSALRVQLLELGLAEVVAGRWVDRDQDRSIELQNKGSERARQAANKRWGRE